MQISKWLPLAIVLGAGPAEAAITAVLESPNEVASEVSNIQGWAFTTTPGASLTPPFKVYVDGDEVLEIPCCGARADVREVHPDAPLATGFSAVFNWGLIDPSPAHPVPADAPRPDPVPAGVPPPDDDVIEVELVITDDAGGVLVLSREVLLATHPPVRFAREIHMFTSNHLPSFTGCFPLGLDRKDLVCGPFVMETRDQRYYCGFTRIEWNRGSQGFRTIDGCAPLVPLEDDPETKTVFASSVPVNAFLDGVEGADRLCQDLAWLEGRDGRFKAWLSDATTSPSDAFTRSSVPYVLVDGTKIADDWADLTDGLLDHAIDRDEAGVKTLGSAFTNTHPDGTVVEVGADHPCNGWTSRLDASGAITGSLVSVLENWTRDIRYDCDGTPSSAPPGDKVARLYCFEQ